MIAPTDKNKAAVQSADETATDSSAPAAVQETSTPTLEDRCATLEAKVEELTDTVAALRTTASSATASVSTDSALENKVNYLLGRAGINPASIK